MSDVSTSKLVARMFAGSKRLSSSWKKSVIDISNVSPTKEVIVIQLKIKDASLVLDSRNNGIGGVT